MQNSPSLNHPNWAYYYNTIGSIYLETGDYLKALSSFKTAHEIFEITFPPNHPSLATSYSNIGSVYEDMGNYSKTFLFHQRALDIGQRVLSVNHPHLQIYREKLENMKKKL